MIDLKNIPPQMLSYRQKTKEWRRAHLDWADKRTYYFGNMVRNSIMKKRINYNLINGVLDMRDVELILNPDSVNALFIPESIQHFPIMNSKLHVLQGEEAKRRFDYKVIVTNPNSISEIEMNKLSSIQEQVQAMIEDENLSQEDFEKELDRLSYYFDYQWQDLIEMRASTVLNHYFKELAMAKTFNANKFQVLTKIVIPANFSTFINSLKVNIGLSLVGVISGEFLVSKAGLGYLIVYGGQVFKLDLVMTSVLILGVVAGIMYLAVLLLEKLILRYRQHS